MKKIKFNKIVLNIMVATLTVACQGPKGEQGTNGKNGKDGNTSLEMGGYSGGGHEVKENSAPLLEYVKKELAERIRRSSDILYEKLPQSWTKEKLAQTIYDIRPIPKERKPRRTDLMFDYVVDSKTQIGSIFATPNYYLAFSTFGFRELERLSRENQTDLMEVMTIDQRRTIDALKLSLLHELAHIVFRHDRSKFSSSELDIEARQFASKIINGLEDDFIKCETTEEQNFWTPTEDFSLDLRKYKSNGVVFMNLSEKFFFGISDLVLEEIGKVITGYVSPKNIRQWNVKELKDRICKKHFGCYEELPGNPFEKLIEMTYDTSKEINADIDIKQRKLFEINRENRYSKDRTVVADRLNINVTLPDLISLEEFEIKIGFKQRRQYFDHTGEGNPIDEKKNEDNLKMNCHSLSTPIDFKSNSY